MKISLAQQPPKMEAVTPDPELRIGKLTNGLTYYLKKNAKPEKQAEFYIFSNVGAIQEEDSQIGLAHFLEHMAFNGTKNFPGSKLVEYLAKIGVKLGTNLNASTGVESTLYMMSGVPLLREGIIDSALLILHDWANYITLDSPKINKERNIIIEELRQRKNAEMRAYEKAMPIIFNHSKYAYRNIIGTEENLKNFPYHELEDFYHKWYTPQRQAIFVVGDIDVNQMEEKIKMAFADILPVKEPARKVMPEIPDNDEPMIGVVSDPELKASDVSVYIRRLPMMRQFNDKIVVVQLQMSIDIMMRMLNHRLAELAHQENAPFIRAGVYNEMLTAGCAAVSGRAVASVGKIEKTVEVFYTELEKARRFGFTDSEFERARIETLRKMQSKFDKRNDRTSRELVPVYISNYKMNTPIPSAETEFITDTTILSTISVLTVNKNAKWVISEKNQSVIVSVPEQDGSAIPTEKDILAIVNKVRNAELETYVDNTIREPLVKKEQLTGSSIQKKRDVRFGAKEWTLANGVKIVVKPTNFKTDDILFSATTPGGLSLSTDSEYMSGKLVVPLIGVSGLANFSAIDMAKQLAGKNVRVTPFINEYNNGFSGNVSPRDIETLLQLLYLYYTAPRFEQSDFNILKEKYSAVLANKAGSPDAVFQDSVVNTIYGQNARRRVLNAQMVQNVDFAAMQKIYRQLFGNARDFTFTFVGNIDIETFGPLVEKYIGSLPVLPKRQNWKDDQIRMVKGEVTNRFQVPMKTPRTTVYYQYSGNTDFTSENMFTMGILNQILRLRYTASIREEKGGAYSVSTKGILINVPINRYSLTVSFHSAPDKVNELIGIVPAEIKKIATEGPLPEDIANIREFLLKQRPEELQDNNIWMMYINTYSDKGVDLYADYDKWVENLDGKKVQQLAAKILKDNNLIRIIMEPENSSEN